jgi:hypothetical protein
MLTAQIIFWKCCKATLSKNYLGSMAAQGAVPIQFICSLD